MRPNVCAKLPHIEGVLAKISMVYSRLTTYNSVPLDVNEAETFVKRNINIVDPDEFFKCYTDLRDKITTAFCIISRHRIWAIRVNPTSPRDKDPLTH